MSADRTHVEVVEDGDEFSVDLHDGKGEDRETYRVVRGGGRIEGVIAILLREGPMPDPNTRKPEDVKCPT